MSHTSVERKIPTEDLQGSTEKKKLLKLHQGFGFLPEKLHPRFKQRHPNALQNQLNIPDFAQLAIDVFHNFWSTGISIDTSQIYFSSLLNLCGMALGLAVHKRLSCLLNGTFLNLKNPIFPQNTDSCKPLLYRDTFKTFILKKKPIQVAFVAFCSVYVNFNLSVFNSNQIPTITGVRQMAEKRSISKDTELEQFEV